MMQLSNRNEIWTVANGIKRTLCRRGWSVSIGKSPRSNSVYVHGKLGRRKVRIRVSDHAPKEHLFAELDVLIHPGGHTWADVKQHLELGQSMALHA